MNDNKTLTTHDYSELTAALLENLNCVLARFEAMPIGEFSLWWKRYEAILEAKNAVMAVSGEINKDNSSASTHLHHECFFDLLKEVTRPDDAKRMTQAGDAA